MTGLSIGWATPWNARSAIAQVAADVALEVGRQGHAITVLRTELGDALELPPRASPWPVCAMADLSTHALQSEFDLVVAHIGDHFGFHGALMPRLSSLGMVGIFHDALVADLVLDWLRQPGGDGEPALRGLVRETYGEDEWPADEPFWTSIEAVALRRPMLEWLARQTIGAVAHADHYAERLRRSCPGPVAVIPLACEFPDLPPPPPPWSRMTVASIGHANPNKRIDQLILAIGASPFLRRICRVRVIGEATADERDRLAAIARAAEIEAPEFTGWVPDEELRWHLRDVDAISCLRNPVLEGASASLLLALTSGRPTLVSGHGCYSEIPDGAVLVCAPEREAFDAMRHLEWLVENPGHGAAIGKRGRAIALTRHTPAVYAEALLPFLDKVVAERPYTMAKQQLGRTMAELAVAPADPAAVRLQSALAGLRVS